MISPIQHLQEKKREIDQFLEASPHIHPNEKKQIKEMHLQYVYAVKYLEFVTDQKNEWPTYKTVKNNRRVMFRKKGDTKNFFSINQAEKEMQITPWMMKKYDASKKRWKGYRIEIEKF